jgi:glutathione S-transferase
MEEKKFSKKDVLITIAIIIAVGVIIYLMAAFEVVRRAHREYNEGEKYLNFYRNPSAKKAYYDEKLQKKEITDIEYEMLMDDNALKNAYVEYQTVVDLFYAPDSQWLEKSKERLKEITPEYQAWVQQLSTEVQKASNAPIKKPK